MFAFISNDTWRFFPSEYSSFFFFSEFRINIKQYKEQLPQSNTETLSSGNCSPHCFLD